MRRRGILCGGPYIRKKYIINHLKKYSKNGKNKKKMWVHIPSDPRPSQHDSAKRIIQRLLSRHDSNPNQPVLPYTVIRKTLFKLVDARIELERPGVYVFHETYGEVECYSTGSYVGCMLFICIKRESEDLLFRKDTTIKNIPFSHPKHVHKTPSVSLVPQTSTGRV
jgi:hypothetical protein